MNRYRFKLPLEKWGDTITKFAKNSKRVALDAFTGSTKNVVTSSSGLIQTRPGDANYEASSTTGTIKDLYEAIFLDGSHHLLRARSGTLEVSTGGGTFASVPPTTYSATSNFEFASYADRVYFGNGVDAPQTYDKVTSYGGVTYTAPTTTPMGAFAPTDPPTATLGAAGNIPAGDYLYKVTFLYYGFEESNGGPASSVVTVVTPSEIDLTDIPIGDYGVTARKIYRSDDDGLSYALVGTISNNTATTLTDDEVAGTADIPTDNGTPRSFSLIVQHKDRLWVAGIAGDRSDLDYSAAGLPDVWPTTNTVLCDSASPITGLVVYNGRVLVFNRNSFGQILGTTPETFYYAPVPGNVGCVDNRTIQIRTIRGVPVVVWLSDKGFYAFNGSTVDYISENIEDLVNFNIQQASQVLGSNSQSSQTDFNSGYKVTNGAIDLTSNPGTITSPNPKYVVDQEAEWEAGSSFTHIVTERTDIPNQLAQAKKNTFTRASGDFAGTVLDGSDVELPVVANFTGNSEAATSTRIGGAGISGLAYKITPSRTGLLTDFTLPFGGLLTVTTYQMRVWDDVAGAPGTTVFTVNKTNDGVTTPVTALPNVTLTGGQSYWIGFFNAQPVNPGNNNRILSMQQYATTMFEDSKQFTSTWTAVSGTSLAGGATASYDFTQTAAPSSGTWTSTTYDSGLYSQALAVNVVGNHTASYPALTSGTTFVDQSDDASMTTGVVSQSVASLSGNNTFSFAATKRYWRFRIQLSSSDDRVTPSITSDPTLAYPTSITWISAAIDGTTELTALNELVTVVGALPAGTTLSATIQKCATIAGSYTDEGTFSLAAGTNNTSLASVTNPTQRFTKIKYTLDNASAPTLTPEIISSTLKWTTVGKFFSQVIDTGATPAGWNIFQSSFASNGGTTTFGFRAAAASASLTDDVPAGPYVPAFVSVTNGGFPSGAAVERFAQWSLSITATADNVPVVDSVTTNWFISSVASVRAASIFFDKEYYCSLAEYGQTANNLVINLDADGLWRIWRGQSVGTLSLFFNEPYFGDASVAQVRKFLTGTSDHGNAIETIVELKAFDLEQATKAKILRQVFVVVEQTGASYTATYSVDHGANYLPLVDAAGATTWTTDTSEAILSKRLVPSSITNGKDLVIKLVSSNLSDGIKIHEIQIDAFVREGDIING